MIFEYSPKWIWFCVVVYYRNQKRYFYLFLKDFIVSLDYMLRILMFLCFHFLHFYITFCYLFSLEFYKLISPMLPSYLTKNIRLIGTLFIHSYTHACTVKFTSWLFIINITDGFYSELSCSTAGNITFALSAKKSIVLIHNEWKAIFFQVFINVKNVLIVK